VSANSSFFGALRHTGFRSGHFSDRLIVSFQSDLPIRSDYGSEV
jgi:hypothetical protein